MMVSQIVNFSCLRNLWELRSVILFVCLSRPWNSPVVGRPLLWGSASSPKELAVETILLDKASMMGGMLYTWGGEGTNKL